MSGWMRAIRLAELGGPEVLQLVRAERPDPGPTEVLVRVRAAGLNPVDWQVREHGAFHGSPPFIPGWDVSGVVEETGQGVALFEPGDEVFGMPRFPWLAGAYAEYVTGPSRHFARKPAGLGHVPAAALPVAGLTAWQALTEIAGITPGTRVLVQAAAGGVGHLAAQIAKAHGAHVIGTARAAKHNFLRAHGVDEPVDYTSVDVASTVHDVDVVLALAAGWERLIATLRRGGLLILISDDPDENTRLEAKNRGVRLAAPVVEPDHHGLVQISELISNGRLRPHVAQTFPLEEAAQAQRLLQQGRVAGKLVLTV